MINQNGRKGQYYEAERRSSAFRSISSTELVLGHIGSIEQRMQKTIQNPNSSVNRMIHVRVNNVWSDIIVFFARFIQKRNNVWLKIRRGRNGKNYQKIDRGGDR